LINEQVERPDEEKKQTHKNEEKLHNQTREEREVFEYLQLERWSEWRKFEDWKWKVWEC